MSGTMGNSITIRSLLTKTPHGLVCHSKPYISKLEAGTCSSLSQAHVHVQPCIPANRQYLTLEDARLDVNTRGNIHNVRTRVIALENCLTGVITPLEEVRQRSGRLSSYMIH